MTSLFSSVSRVFPLAGFVASVAFVLSLTLFV